jgi:hypothetical protein
MGHVSRTSLAAKVGGLVLLARLCTALGRWPARTVDPGRCEIVNLVADLDDRGFGFRTVLVMHNGPVGGGVFLTTTDLSWEELNRLPLGLSSPDSNPPSTGSRPLQRQRMYPLGVSKGFEHSKR